jgi:hypothetical protein
VIGSAGKEHIILFSVEGTTMILREWGEIRQLYKACTPRLSRGWRVTQPAWVYWSIRALIGFVIILIPLTLIDVFNAFGFPKLLSVFGFATLSLQQALVIISLLTAWALVRLLEKAFANEFKMLYATYGLRHYPWWRRRLYLHYALFLRALTNRTSPVSREMITRLRSFADIAEKPPPLESRLLQPAYIVPFIVLLNVLITELLKQAELLKGRMGILILILYVSAILIIYVVLKMWHVVPTNSGQVIDRTIQRFLQWAEHDIEEAQLLKIRSPHMILPGSPES